MSLRNDIMSFAVFSVQKWYKDQTSSSCGLTNADLWGDFMFSHAVFDYPDGVYYKLW